MQEHKIDDLLGSYSESLGHFEGAAPMPRRKSIRLWKPILVTGMGTALVAGFVFVPRSAEAASIDKVMSGLNSVKYWHSVAWQRDPKTGVWISGYSETYLNGVFKLENRPGQHNAMVDVLDSGFIYSDHKQLPYILKSKLDAKDIKSHFNPETHPWQYYKKASFTRKEGVAYKGQPAYSLSVSGKKSGTVFEAIIQKSTNLPLVIQMQTTEGKGQFSYKTEYQYDKPISLDVIAPNPSKPIVDEEKSKRGIVSLWSKQKPDQLGPTVYSSTISPDGTIWIAFGVTDHTKKDWGAAKIVGGDYTISSSYLMNSFGASKDFLINGKEVIVASFIPTVDSPIRPEKINVLFGRYPYFTSIYKGGKSAIVSCPLQKNEWAFPSYLVPIMQVVPLEFIADRFYGIRAHAQLAKGNLRSAAKLFEKEADVFIENHYYFSNWMNPLKAAAECYEKLGDTAKAQELRKLIPKGEHAQY